MVKKKTKTRTRTKAKPLATEIGVLENLRARTVQTRIEDGKIVRVQPRTSADTCSTCIKYDTTTSTCRLNPPIYLQRQSAPTDPAWSWQWPIVQATDWCYQWSLT
jgi:hypothetical protein